MKAKVTVKDNAADDRDAAGGKAFNSNTAKASGVNSVSKDYSTITINDDEKVTGN